MVFKFKFVSFFHKFPLFSRLCAMPSLKYVSFSLVFALMGISHKVEKKEYRLITAINRYILRTYNVS